MEGRLKGRHSGSGVVTINFPPLDEAWYVADYGYVGATGRSRTSALPSVEKALAAIAAAHTTAKVVAPTAPNGLTGATIVVIGISDDKATITIDNLNRTHPNTIYPPITLRGLSPSQPGILTANKGGWTNPTGTDAYRVLLVTKMANVTLGNDLTITGGEAQRRYPRSLSDLWIFASKLAQKSRFMGSLRSLSGKKFTF
jgi:hypothetical protein